MNISVTQYYILIGTAASLLLIGIGIAYWLHRRKQKAFERLVEEQSAPLAEEQKEWPKVSIVVVSQEHAVALKQSLPTLLEQQYPHFEVVVVDAASTDDTEDVIKHLSSKYDHLRRTFFSHTGHIKDIQQFALMLGLRAARTDWVVLTHPGCEPASEEWLMRMARHINDDTDLIIGTSEGDEALNLCLRKDIFSSNGHSLHHLEKRYRTTYEWSPQACIYQRE